MKKSLIMLLVLMVVGAMAFAEDAKPTFTISGDATVTFGANLNTPLATGFENSGSATLKVVLVPLSTVTKGGEGDVYGQITIKDFGYATKNATDADPVDGDNTKAGTITAKLIAGPAFVQFGTGATDYSFDYATNISGDTDVNLKGIANGYGGLLVGYSSDMFGLSVGANSMNPWYTDAVAAVSSADPVYPITEKVASKDASNHTANTNNYYTLGGTLTLKPADQFSAEVKFVYASVATPFFGMGGKIVITPMDKVTFTVPFDLYNGQLAGASVTLYDATPALSFGIGDDTLTASAYYSNVTDVQGAANTNSELDAKAEFVEADGDKGFVPGLGADVAFSVNNLMPITGVNLGWSTTVKVNYTVDTVKPYVETTYGDNQKLALKGGVVFTGWTNTTLTAQYASDNLLASTTNAMDNGKFTVALKVAY